MQSEKFADVLTFGIESFECCTFDHSDNSPCLFSSGFLSRNLLKNSLERKQERRQKIFDFEIFCVEEYQGEAGGRNSQIPPKFRVSPVMTTSIPLLVTGCIIPYFPLGCNFFFCGVYFDAAAHVLMGEGGRLWRSGC